MKKKMEEIDKNEHERALKIFFVVIMKIKFNALEDNKYFQIRWK